MDTASPLSARGTKPERGRWGSDDDQGHPNGGRRDRDGSIEVDDFTIEVLYAGLAEMLREAVESPGTVTPATCELPA